MKILVNATAAAAGTAGETYFANMLPALAARDPRKRYAVVMTERQRPLDAALPASIERIWIDAPASRALRVIAVQRMLRRLVRTGGADVLFNTGNFFTPRAGCRQVCFIENTNAFSRPGIQWTMGGRLRNYLLQRLTRRALADADAVVLPSDNARRLMSRLAFVRAPITVIPYGCSPIHERRQPPEGLPPRFILSVSSLYPHKNLPILVRAFKRLIADTRYDGQLVIVGYGGPAVYRRRLDAVIEETGLRDRVLVRPPTDRPTLAAYYRAADLSVVPSIEESFGIPIIEAMLESCPVVVADTALGAAAESYFNPFREICGDAAEYFDPFSVDSIAKAIATSLEPSRHAELRLAGPARAARYTWTEGAAALDRIFDGVNSRSINDSASPNPTHR